MNAKLYAVAALALLAALPLNASALFLNTTCPLDNVDRLNLGETTAVVPVNQTATDSVGRAGTVTFECGGGGGDPDPGPPADPVEEWAEFVRRTVADAPVPDPHPGPVGCSEESNNPLKSICDRVWTYKDAITGAEWTNSTVECRMVVDFPLQCTKVTAGAGVTDSRECGMEVGTPETYCYRIFGSGYAFAFVLAGDLSGTVFGAHFSCSWEMVPNGWGGCEASAEDALSARPGAKQCGFTKATSVAWYILPAVATTDCD